MATINVKATHTTLTGSIQAYINKKIQSFQKFLHEENNIHVVLEVEPKHHTGPRFRAEITILPRPGIFAEAYGNDLYEAIDLAVPKVKEQILKNKDKRISKARREQRLKRM